MNGSSQSSLNMSPTGLPLRRIVAWGLSCVGADLVRRERSWLYLQRHPSHSQRITMSGLAEYRGTYCPSSIALMPRHGAAPRTCTRSIATFWDMITIIPLREYNERRERFIPALKYRASPPGNW